MSALQSAVIGAALEGKTPDQIEAATGNPYNIALGALLGVAGSYAAAFRLGRAVLVLASLGGGGSAAYNAYKQDHIAAAVYYATLGLGGALLGNLRITRLRAVCSCPDSCQSGVRLRCHSNHV